MNRLSPWIVRRPRATAVAAAYAVARSAGEIIDAAPSIGDDLRLFGTAFLGGLVFFGTYLA